MGKDVRKVICINRFIANTFGAGGTLFEKDEVYECQYIKLTITNDDAIVVYLENKANFYRFNLNDERFTNNFIDYKVYERKNKLNKI